jgi:transposase InsO family protein
MIASIVYWVVRRLVELLVGCRSDAENAVEVVVLRHQVAVLRRRVGRPRLSLVDRILLSALAQLLPRDRWESLFVRPETIRRWHRARRRTLDVPTHNSARPPSHQSQQPGIGCTDRTFDDVFKSEGIQIVRTPVQAPKANAFAERLVGTIHRDCPDRILIVNRRHLERVLPTYIDHYNTHRPHRSLDQRPPALPTAPPRPPGNPANVRRRNRLGGLIHKYETAA